MNERKPDQLQSPPDSPSKPTACQYCVVGCAYQVFDWQPGTGSDDPPALEQALWVSPAMTGQIRSEGEVRTAAVVPDPKCELNKGNHSPRGGTQGRNLVFADDDATKELDSTRERVRTAYIRTQRGFEPIDVDRAISLLIGVVKTATGWRTADGQVEFSSPSALGVKMYEYQYLENTFAATTLFYQIIGTPNLAYQDRPSTASNTAGFEDSGIDPHGFSYEDIWDSDVIFLAGINPYEAHSIFFAQAMAGKRIIVLDPRRTITADYAVKTNGLHLRPKVLGAETLVLNAIARYIRDQQKASPAEWPLRVPADLIAKQADIDQARSEAATVPDDTTRRRRANYHLSLSEFYQFLDETHPDGAAVYTLERASRLSGISVSELKECARILAGPDPAMEPPRTRKVSLLFEKGLIWGYNYQNTAAMANLSLLLGSVLRPSADNGEGTNSVGVSGRAGGHQKGWAEAGNYPFKNSRDLFCPPADPSGRPTFPYHTNHYLDAHLVGTKIAPVHAAVQIESKVPDINLFWVIGSNAAGTMANAEQKWTEVDRRRGDLPLTVDDAELNWTTRLKSGRLVVVQQDIYPNATTMHADLLLPAAGWGEEDLTRYNGERRLRLYSRFQDSPAYHTGNRLERISGKIVSRCLPDWKIFQRVAQALLPDGTQINSLKNSDVAWKTSADVFLDLAQHSNRKNYLGSNIPFLSDLASTGGPTGHDLLKAQDPQTNGIILPAVRTDKPTEMKQYRRVPVVNQFKLNEGRKFGPYAFVRADWIAIEPHFEANRPREEHGEFTICNGRINELWNSMFSHIRNETVRQRYPDDLPGTIIEFHPGDALRLDIRDGDIVEVLCSKIHMGANRGTFNGVASIQSGGDESFLPPGFVFALFSYPANEKMGDFPYRKFQQSGYVNNITTGYVDPANPIAAVKYARGEVRKTGAVYRRSAGMIGPVFLPRNRALLGQRVGREQDRLEWKVRELVVQKGLPRMSLHPSDAASLMRTPDQMIFALKTDATFRGFFCDALKNGYMYWKSYDKWSGKELALVIQWMRTLGKTCFD